MTANQTPPPAAPDAGHQQAHTLNLAATQFKRYRLIALLAVVLIAAATSCHSKASGGEVMLAGATDPGANAFMPPAASPPPTDTQPPPTLQPQGDGATLETQALPGDRDGVYGGTDNNAGIDRDKMIDFLGSHPAQAGAFVESLNTDNTVYWSGGRPLTVADIPTYLHELTPALLRLDTRITNHGFDGRHFTTVQSVFQTGTAVLVDAHGVPRVRGLSGNSLTAPIALAGTPKLVGTPWPGYDPGALARVQPTTAKITNFVLVDVVTGQPFNRPAGTTGTDDTPHTQAVAPPGPATSAAPTKEQAPGLALDGTYLLHNVSVICSGIDMTQYQHDYTFPVTHQGDQLIVYGYKGPMPNADGSFSGTTSFGWLRGVFATEGGRTVLRDAELTMAGAQGPDTCHRKFTATKQ